MYKNNNKLSEYNIIFLDIDGVLSSEIFFTNNYYKQNKGFIDPIALDKLILLLNENNYKIVLSSSWRMDSVFSTLEYFKTANFGVNKGILMKLEPYLVGVTPFIVKNNKHLSRGTEIQKFIEENNIKNYVILDDDEDMLESQKNNFIHIDNYYGIQDKDLNNIKKLFDKMS